LESGWAKAKPIRHCPADSLNFLAEFKKMMSSSSRLIALSMSMRMLTILAFEYVMMNY